ncbi:class III signal peptide-containing protein [Methanococcus aeolicus]|uniref:class III signal peptide-containing protein n=1 Tax=Methanococcus aeolicus TaxID=42879 RepID=UPI0021CA8D29|nr:class III signal peptide-containing protein [Methanococcus aeolicus]UXM84085.1 class III signal peptide-containing protein [Methanococcus aeolicus]
MKNMISKKAQLSLEMALLMLAVVASGAVIGYFMMDDTLFEGDSLGQSRELSSQGFIGNKIINNNPQISYEDINTTTDTEDDDKDDDEDTVVLPDLLPTSIIIKYTNGTGIAHGWRELVQNNGNEHQLTDQFGHQEGNCDNNSNIYITVDIKDINMVNITDLFYVALYDNDEKVDTAVASKIGKNEWKVVFNYTITTSNGSKNQNQHQNNGQHQYQNHGDKSDPIYDHTLKALVDCGGVINESNEDNNEITANISITKSQGPHENDNEIITSYDISLGMNINPTNSEKNNALEIYDIDGHTYNLYKSGNKKGLINENNHKIYIDSGNSKSGNATKIIFRAKGSNTDFKINGITYDVPSNFKKYTIIANNIDDPIEYTISHDKNGAGGFYISLTSTNATVYITKGNDDTYIIRINDGKIDEHKE